MTINDQEVKSSKIISIDPFLRLLIANALAGNWGFIVTAKKYYIDGESPSTIAREMGLSTKQIRIWIQRAKEKTGSNDKRARRILEKTYSFLMNINPITEGDFCKLCGRPYAKKLVWHIYYKHAALILAIYNEIVKEIFESKK